MHKKYQGGGTVKKDSLLIFKGDEIFLMTDKKCVNKNMNLQPPKAIFAKFTTKHEHMRKYFFPQKPIELPG